MYFEVRSTIKHRAHEIDEESRRGKTGGAGTIGEGEEEYIVRRLEGREESEFVGPICVMMIMMMMA